jgi:hypothetical protein
MRYARPRERQSVVATGRKTGPVRLLTFCLLPGGLAHRAFATDRQAPGGTAFHVLKRGVGRMRLFEKDGDYEAFERVLIETLSLRPMGLPAHRVMPNHWSR